jgi:hypothetical protein
MRKTLIVLLFAALPALCAAQDPYPAYLAQLATETNAAESPTQIWSYWGTGTDSMGWTDYYIVNTANGQEDVDLVIHVPTPGAPLDAAFIGDSSIGIMTFYNRNAVPLPNTEGLLPDLATGNFAIGGEHCVGTQARFAEVAALAPRTIVIACGNGDIYYPNTPGSVDAKDALVAMMQAGKSLPTPIPIIIGALTPTEPALPTLPNANPSLIAEQIRAFNDWIRGVVTANGVLFWNRWFNLAASEKSNYGAADCYMSDGVHALYCNQRTIAGLRYLIGESADASPTDTIETADLTPTISISASNVVTLSDTDTNATIYYTITPGTSGTAPTISSTKYTGTFTLTATSTVEAIAVDIGYSNSAVASQTDTIETADLTPTISISTSNVVTLSDTDTNATIYYTIIPGTSGTAPTTGSTMYTGTFTLTATSTVEAIAVDTGYNNSAIASQTDTISSTAPPYTVGVSTSSLTVTAGQSSSPITITITPTGGFASAVTFSCSGLPTGATCSFAPASITPPGTATTQLTIATTSASAAVRPNSNPLFPGATLAIALCCFLGFRKRRALQMLILVTVSVIGLSLFTGCGGSTKSSVSTVVVTASSGTVQETSNIALTVNN